MEGASRSGLRILLVDDEPIVRSGIREMLLAAPDLQVAGEASGSEDALALAVQLRPDVVVIEARIHGRDSTGTIRELRACLPQTGILVFSSYAEPQLAVECTAAGACGYLLKRATGERLVDAIRTVGRGECVADSWLTGYLFKVIRARTWEWSPDSEFRLSPRDDRLLTLVAAGKSNRQIATDLNLAEQTVKNQLSMLLHRLGIARRVLVTQYVGRLDRSLYS
ncbi:MAG TPA: response regulator transcription factor [Candidatus Udaeobacter sp.]|nr:response regulator transcription factor [Candidatus Udaeobacter sp.]